MCTIALRKLTEKEEAMMKRIIDTKMCPSSNKLLKDVKFGIFKEEEDGVVYFRLYRTVNGVKDKCPLVSSRAITDVYVLLQGLNS